MNRNVVAVFGTSRARPDEKLYQNALELGRAIAQLGLVLCNGGYGGTMEASARGAVEAGGHTIGVTCKRLGRGGPNPYIRQEVPAADLFERLRTLLRLGQAYVVLPGGTGTLAELALAWELLNKGLLSGERPLIVLGDSWQPVLDCVTRVQPTAVPLHVVADVSAAREVLSQIVG